MLGSKNKRKKHRKDCCRNQYCAYISECCHSYICKYIIASLGEKRKTFLEKCQLLCCKNSNKKTSFFTGGKNYGC